MLYGCDSNAATFLGATLSGTGLVATGSYATAVGYLSKAGIQATALGAQVTASNYSIAIGTLSKTSAAGAIAIGGYPAAGVANAVGAQAAATNAIAVGSGSSVVSTATSGIAVGNGATVNGTFGIAQGDGITSGATGQNVAIGSSGTTANSSTAAGGAVAIGRGQTATGNGAVAIGDPNVANGTGAVTMGADNTAAGNLAGTIAANGAVAIGNGNTAIGQGSVALGNASRAAAAGTVALGDTAVANNTNDVALGSKSTTAAPHTGTTAQFGATAAGVQAAASTNGVVSVGAAGTERQIQNVAAGVISATSTDAINGSQLNSVVTGVNNVGTTTASTLGGGATYSPATGNITGFSQPINSISATGAVAGPTAQTTVAAALTALNTNVDNTANIAVKYDAVGGNAITLGATGGAGAPAGGVKITNLSAGALNGTSTDAVNGSQLFATNTAVSNVVTQTTTLGNTSASTLGGGATYSSATGVTGFSLPINAISTTGAVGAATTQTSVAGALTALNTDTVNTANIAVKYDAVGGNAITLGATGGAGAPAGGVKITNLSAGALNGTSTDAVNGSQLFSTNQSINNIINNGLKYFHANSALADSTATGTDSVAVGPAASSTATNAVAIGNGAVSSVADSVALGSGATTAAATATATGVVNGTTYTYAGAAPIGVLSVGSAGNERQISNVAAGKVTAASTDAINGSQLFATNTAVDAVGVQTTTLGNTSASTLGGGATYSAATGITGFSQPINSVSTTGAVGAATAQTSVAGALTALNTDTVNTANIAVKYDAVGGNAITLGATGGAGAPAGGVKITNLSAGTLNGTSTDAVNGSQLFATDTAVSNLGIQTTTLGNTSASTLGGGATYSAATGLTGFSLPINAISTTGAVGAATAQTSVAGALTALNTDTVNTANIAVKYDAVGGNAITLGATGGAGAPAGGVKITNLSAGALNGTSTDAVNGSQLFATDTAVNNLGTQTTTLGNTSASTLGGGATYSSATGLTGFSLPINAISTTGAVGAATAQTSVADALTALNTDTVNTANIAVKYDAVGGNAITLGATGGAGAPAGGVKITNLSAGALNGTSTDAVNGSQLFATNQTVDGLVNNGAGIKYFHSNSILADSTATGTDSVAVGPAASSTATNAVAIGNGAVASVANSLALGNGATTTAATSTPSGIVNGTTFTYAGAAPIGVLSVGSVGNERQITNVAAGQVTAASTDAVNGSQLFATDTAVNNLGTQTTTLGNTSASTLGGGATYSSATGITGFSQPINSVSTTGAVGAATAQTSVAGALTALNTDTVNTANIAVKYDAVGGNAITLGATGGVGAPAGGVKITNLSAGALNGTSTDAVNGSQLFATDTAVSNLGTQTTTLGNTSASTLGGGATYSAATGLTGFSLPINAISTTGAVGAATAQTSVAGALTALNTDTVNTANIAVKYDAVGGNAITLGATGGAGAPAGGVKITNLSAGALNGTSTDAVNGSQLFATNQTVDGLVNNGAGIKYFHSNSILADSTATGTDSVAVGPAASSTATNAVAIGNGAVSSVADSVALGSGATTAAATATATGVVNGTTYTYAGAAPIGVLSVGSAGNERQVTNVAAGQVTAASTDAINGSQLFATNTAVDAVGAQTTTLGNTSASTLGGGATYSPATGITGFSQPINSVSTTGAVGAATAQTSVAGALTALNTDTVNTANIAVKYDAVGGNAITLGATGGAGAPAGGVKITNLSAGALNGTSTDAVNGSQLFATNQTVDGLVNNGAGIKYFHSNSVLADSTATGTDSVAVGPAASSTATNAVAIGNGAVSSVADSVALGSGATTAAATATATGVVNGTTFTYAGAAPIGVLSVGSVGNERQVTNVAAGQVTAASTDAVNGSQLFATNTAVDAVGTQTTTLGNTSASTLGGGATYSAATGLTGFSLPINAISTTGAVGAATAQTSVAGALTALNTDTVNTANIAVKYDAVGGNAITLGATGGAGAPAGGVKITNLSAGALNGTSTDAVNGSQLFATNQTVDGLVNNGAGIKYFHANSILADSSATGLDSVAIGPLASATVANGVALGSNSSATGATLANAAYGVGGAATGGEVNIANGANGRRLTGLAAGASATDAVNVSQLNKVGQDTATALGGGAALDAATGAWTAPSYSTNSISVNGTNTGPLASNNVGAALTNLNTSLTNTAAVAVKYDDASTKTQVTFNPAGTAVKLTNVAAGTLNGTSTDAVNGSQLFATNQTVDGLVNNGAGIKYFHSNSILADSSATGLDSVAVGPTASATAANGVAIGNGAVAGTANSIALGNGATTAAANATATGVVNGTTFNYAGATPTGVLSVGSLGNERQVTNVAAGRVSASSTDAINGSQLFSTNTAVDGLGTQVDNLVNNGTGIKYFHSNSILADSTATGLDSVAVGPAASATAANGVAIGSGAVAGTANSIALGNGATTAAANATATGVVNGSTFNYAGATPTGVLSVGSLGNERQITNVAAGRVSASSTDAINGSQLFSTNTAVDGLGTQVDNLVNNGTGIKYFHSNSVLADSTATGLDSVAVGPAASATVANGVALGSNSSATGATLANAAYGVGGAATGGEVNIANGANGRRITGLAAGSSDTDAVNVSQLNKVGQDTATALGGGAALDATAGTWTAPNYSTNSISVNGTNTGPLASNNVGAALTNLNTSLTNTAAVAVKYDDASTKTQVTFNPAGTAVKLTNVAAGALNGTSTDAVNGSQLFATNQSVDNIVNNGTGIKYFHSNSVLADSTATGLDSVAVGPASIAAGANSFAAGSGANAAADGGVALGRQSQVQVSGGIALGEGSVADRALAPTTGTIPVGSGAIIYDTSDATLLGSVSVGKAGSYRQITNVADATEAHDAVNLRQLTGAMGSLSSTGTRYFHANSTNPADSLASGAESVAVGPATVVNGDNGVGIGNQATVGLAAAGGIAIGRNTQVLQASGIAMGSAAQASAEQSVALGAGANASHAMSVALGSSSVTTVGAETNYSAYRLAAPQTSVGEIGLGTAQGNRKLTGVAAGTQDNDAVNVAQLKWVGDQVDQNTTDITSLGGRVGGLENLIGSGGGIKYLHVNSTSADSAATGTDAMALGPKAQASGNSSVAVGNDAKASADGSVALGSGSSDEGRGAETYSGKYSGANNQTAGTVSVGNAATGATRTVSNIADGKDANDAVNVRQLDGAVSESKQYTDVSIANLGGNSVQQGARISVVEGDVSNIKNGTDGMFQVNNTSAAAKPKATGVDSIAGGTGAVASGKNSAAVGTRSQATGENSVAVGNGAKASAKNATALGANSVADRDNSVSVGSVGNERQLTNIAAGTSGTDAVNYDQLTKSVAGITDSANAYTDQRYSELKDDIKKQDDILSAGIAGAMAMASMPQSSSPGASMTTVAASTYRGQASVAFGVSHLSGNGRWLTKLQGSTDSQRQVGVAVGVGYQW
jgi:autotransporter adhesin